MILGQPTARQRAWACLRVPWMIKGPPLASRPASVMFALRCQSDIAAPICTQPDCSRKVRRPSVQLAESIGVGTTWRPDNRSMNHNGEILVFSATSEVFPDVVVTGGSDPGELGIRSAADSCRQLKSCPYLHDLTLHAAR